MSNTLIPSNSSIGKLWWNADNLSEAKQWEAEYLAKGAISVELKPEDNREIVNVFITLDRARAQQILGCEVGDEEWLDMSESMKLTVHEIRKGNLVVSLTKDAYEYNNEFFTIEVSQMDGSECVENDADLSGLPVSSNKAEIDLFLSAAMKYAIANCMDELEPLVRRLSHPAAQAGLNAIAKVEP